MMERPGRKKTTTPQAADGMTLPRGSVSTVNNDTATCWVKGLTCPGQGTEGPGQGPKAKRCRW